MEIINIHVLNINLTTVKFKYNLLPFIFICQQLLKRKGGGRIGCHEVMTGTPAIRNLIREGKVEQIPSTLQTSLKDGMFTMEKCLEGLRHKDLVE